MLLTSIIISLYTFIACIEKHMPPHYNVLPEAVFCCLLVNNVVLPTCNYDQSLVVTDTNQYNLKISSFDITSFLRYGCRTRRRSRRTRIILPIIAPYIYDGGHGPHPCN